MGQFAFLTFAIVLLVAVISPGPAIAALVARIMARGTEGIAAFCAGLVLGDLIWLSPARCSVWPRWPRCFSRCSRS